MSDVRDLIPKMRSRIDDLDVADYEYSDDELFEHLQNSLDKHDLTYPLEKKSDEQFIILEAMIAMVMAIKLWADGESYSYKNDAIQMTRGLMSKHYKDTIELLEGERDEIVARNGGFY